jgi:hypothetical protein
LKITKEKDLVSVDEIKKLVDDGQLGSESYVWTKGYDDWKKIKDVDVLSQGGQAASFQFASLNPDEKCIYIRTGADRGGVPTDYGPYSLTLVKRLYDERRISAKTLVYTKGLSHWTYMGDASDFQEIFNDAPPTIEQSERRKYERKPFVARILMSDNTNVFEGICRDISIGGMQVLVSGLNLNVGQELSFNVHPENTDYSFVASGKVVRVLEANQGFSFRFHDLNSEAQNAIIKYIALE